MRGLVVAVLVLAGLFVPSRWGRAQEPEPVVHAILFYSPTCPHCHQVITEVLIPMQEEYGQSLVIMGFDTTQPAGNSLYWDALRHFHIPEEQWVVPILIVADQIMVGGIEIPNQFPAMVDAGLAGDGIDLPDFPALLTLLGDQGMLDRRFPDRRIALQDPPVGVRPEAVAPGVAGGQEVEAEAEEEGDTLPAPSPDFATGEEFPGAEAAPPGRDTAVAEDSAVSRDRPSPAEGGGPLPGEERGEEAASPQAERGGMPREGPVGLAQAAQELESRTMWDKFNQDVTGNSFSVVVLLFMVVSLALKGYPPRARGGDWPTWVVPVLALLGMGVAAYLSYIEVTHSEAVCGPVGDCNTVNQSEFAVLFGILPVGVLGMAGYVVILVLWALGRLGPAGAKTGATLGAWGAVLLGTLFSVYLTFLEPFVIGATCAWCLSSALIMTLLLWALSPTAREAWPRGGSVDA